MIESEEPSDALVRTMTPDQVRARDELNKQNTAEAIRLRVLATESIADHIEATKELGLSVAEAQRAAEMLHNELKKDLRAGEDMIDDERCQALAGMSANQCYLTTGHEGKHRAWRPIDGGEFEW